MGRKLEEVGKSQKGPVAGPVPLWLTGAENQGSRRRTHAQEPSWGVYAPFLSATE